MLLGEEGPWFRPEKVLDLEAGSISKITVEADKRGRLGVRGGQDDSEGASEIFIRSVYADFKGRFRFLDKHSTRKTGKLVVEPEDGSTYFPCSMCLLYPSEVVPIDGL